MRTSIPNLDTAHPLAAGLPAVYQEDEFVWRWMAGFDDALAPVFLTIDCLDAYFDAALAPPDFLPWLGQWVGAVDDQNWTEDARRRLIGRLADLYGSRGTAGGITELVQITTGGDVEIVDSGATTWSPAPGSDLPGTAEATLTVRVRVADPSTIDPDRVARVVRWAAPAHVRTAVEVLPT